MAYSKLIQTSFNSKQQKKRFTHSGLYFSELPSNIAINSSGFMYKFVQILLDYFRNTLVIVLNVENETSL